MEPFTNTLKFKSYQELYKIAHRSCEIHCERKHCSFDWAENRKYPVIIYQFKLYCSIGCFVDDICRSIGWLDAHCSHCHIPVDMFTTRYSFTTSTGVVHGFCGRLCFDEYLKNEILCHLCWNRILSNTHFIDTGKVIFCSKNCMWLSISRPSGEQCLTCNQVIPTSATILQHEASPLDLEHFCSFKCRLEFKAPFKTVEEHKDQLRIQRPPEQALICLVCCRSLVHTLSRTFLYGMGRRLVTCCETCSTMCKMMYRIAERCNCCKIQKTNSDMLEVLAPLRDCKSLFYCSLKCFYHATPTESFDGRIMANIFRDGNFYIGDGVKEMKCIQCFTSLQTADNSVISNNRLYCSTQCMSDYRKTQRTNNNYSSPSEAELSVKLFNNK